MSQEPRLAVRTFVVICLVFIAGFSGAFAESPAVGHIEGRVFNPATGEYLENTRISVEGTALETFTDSGGRYRLTNVPAGVARVNAFRTRSFRSVHFTDRSGRLGLKGPFESRH